MKVMERAECRDSMGEMGIHRKRSKREGGEGKRKK